MWNRPAPYIDDSDDSATRPFSSAETPAQQPARVRSALRRALRVLIPTVVAGAVVIGFAAMALGNHVPRIGTTASTRASATTGKTAGALRPTSDCGPLPSGAGTGAALYTQQVTQPSGTGTGAGTGTGTGTAAGADGNSPTQIRAPGPPTVKDDTSPPAITNPPAAPAAPPQHVSAMKLQVCGVGFHAHSTVRFSLSRAGGAPDVQIPGAGVTTDGNGSFSAQVPAVLPAQCGIVQLQAKDAQGTTATMVVHSFMRAGANSTASSSACTVP
jgi:hypothetical protein